MRRLLPLLALAPLAFAPAPFPKPDPGKADLERMQGTWLLARAHNRGRPVELGGSCTWTIKGDVLTTTRDGKGGSTCYIVLEGRTKPGCIDLRGRRGDADPAQGRYRIEGDTLTVCMGPGVRPRDLSGFGPSNGVSVYNRVK